MTEKKTTVAPATKAAVKKTATKKVSVKKATVVLNAENVGFKAGDVYQALAAAGKSLTVAEIAKAASITTEEAYLGIGWLFKEGKIKGDDKKNCFGLITKDNTIEREPFRRKRLLF